jgi:hypothetical protein
MNRWIPLAIGVVCGALFGFAVTAAQARSTEPPAVSLESSAPEPNTASDNVDCLVLRTPTESFLEVWMSHQLDRGRNDFIQGSGAMYRAQGTTFSPAEWICAYSGSRRRTRSASTTVQ